MISIMDKVHLGLCPVQKCCRKGVMSELLRALQVGACSTCVFHLSLKHDLRRGEATGPLHQGEKLCWWIQRRHKGCLNLASCSWCVALWSSVPVVNSSCHGWTDRNDICFFCAVLKHSCSLFTLLCEKQEQNSAVTKMSCQNNCMYEFNFT